VVEEETGVPLDSGIVAAGAAGDAVTATVDEAPEAEAAAEAPAAPTVSEEKRLIARDAKNVPLLSVYHWHGEAIERILRVPAGFMRNRTQDRIEVLAAERGLEAINLAVVEEGIAIGRQMMEEMIRNQEAAKAAAASAGTTAPHPEGNGMSAAGAPVDASHEATGAVSLEERKPPINEVGSPSALQARRAGPHPQLEGH
jgi:hypothetical protein